LSDTQATLGDWIWRGLFLAAIVGIIVGSMLVTDAVTVAKRHVIAKGLTENFITLDQFKVDGRWFGRTAEVKYWVKGVPKESAVVELSQPASFLPWRVTNFYRIPVD
jgi:hypothetical protein